MKNLSEKNELIQKLHNADPALKLLFAKVLDRFFLCALRGTPAFTDFYDPVKGGTFLNALTSNASGVTVTAFGGAHECERRMIGFFPDSDFSLEQFPISRLRISHAVKFNKPPRHKDYLGALISMGFDRGRTGDIIISQGYADVFVCADIAEYIAERLTSVGSAPVKTALLPLNTEESVRTEGNEKILTVASLRLDALISAVFHISRSQASAFISGEKVFLNWSPIKDSAKTLKPGDMVTLRGYGRVQISDVLGETKKDRLRLAVVLYK